MADVMPPGAIPVDQFQAAEPNIQMPKNAIPVDKFESQEDAYGTPGQTAIAGLEGVAQGVAGPLAPAAERLLGVSPESIRGRAAQNPIARTIGEGAGLLGGALTGTGEAAVMSKAGEMAAAAAGLGDIAKTASYGAKVGSSAVKQAAEMAVMQGSDETAKMVLQDPNASAQTAIANIGLAAALGGAGGAFITGAVSPLWEATAGPQVDKFLGGLKDHLNGGGKLLMPEAIDAAQKELGIELTPEMRAGISGDPKAAQMFNELREVQKPEIIQGIENLHRDASEAVIHSLGIGTEDIANYSENQTAHDLMDTFIDEYKEKIAPTQEKYDVLKESNENASLFNEDKMNHVADLLEKGRAVFNSPGNPYQDLFNKYGERLLEQETIGQTDKLVTEIGNEWAKAIRAGDNNTATALKEIKTSIQNFQEESLNKILEARPNGMRPDIVAERQAVRQEYAKIANISREISQQMGLGEFKGAKALMFKLGEKKSPEQILNALSPKGNADLIPFMQKDFPRTLEKVRENETKKLVRPAILAAKGENSINLKVLNNAVEKGLAGQQEYIKFALPPGALEKIQAAKTLTEALPDFKSSGTAGWQQKLMKHMPASALSAVSLVTGHGMIGGYVAGHLAQLLGREAPDAIKLGLLRFLASDQPVKAEGFKAMVDFLHASYKGDMQLTKAASNVFKPGFQILSTSQEPNMADLQKLDKLVAKSQTQPSSLIQAQNGHVGHYLPAHQVGLAQTSTQAVQYLQTLKPQPYQPNPLDKPIEPSKLQEARYNRALMIAQQPAIVFQHIKDGTLQSTDLQDLNGMYPQLYSQMSQKLTNAMFDHKTNQEPIPYKTKVGASLFLGQPLDSTMLPSSIQAAQPQPKQPPQMPQGKTKKGAASLGKSNNQYRTPGQAAEYDRSKRD